MIPCPNLRHPDFDRLEKEFGRERAWLASHRNGGEPPSAEKARELLTPRASESLLKAADAGPRVSPEEDKAYADAVAKGETKTVQRMVDDAAKRVGLPTRSEVLKSIGEHPLVKFKLPVKRVFIVGSLANGSPLRENSDVDVLIETKPITGVLDYELESKYRRGLQNYFVKNDIRGVRDDLHPQLLGRRADLYLTYDADEETRPKVSLDAVVRDPKGNVIPLSERFNPASNSILRAADAGPRPATDAEHRAALDRGDTETAQRMVDEAALKAGYEPTRLIHHGAAGITEFRDTPGNPADQGPAGIYMASDPDRFSGFKKGGTYDLYAKIQNPAKLETPLTRRMIENAKDYMGNPKAGDEKFNNGWDKWMDGLRKWASRERADIERSRAYNKELDAESGKPSGAITLKRSSSEEREALYQRRIDQIDHAEKMLNWDKRSMDEPLPLSLLTFLDKAYYGQHIMVWKGEGTTGGGERRWMGDPKEGMNLLEKQNHKIAARDFLKSLGFDGVDKRGQLPKDKFTNYMANEGQDWGEIIAFDPEQVKSAAPDTGEPLSQRFNPESRSILKAADAGEPAPMTSAAMNAEQAEGREKIGLAEREAPIRRAFGKMYADARAAMKADPSIGKRLVDQMTFTPRPMTDTEDVIMAAELLDREITFDEAAEALDAAPPEGRAAANQAYEDAYESFRLAIEASERVGTLNARGLAARRVTLQRAFNRGHMLAAVQKAGGGKDLSRDQTTRVEALYQKIRDLEKELQNHEYQTSRVDATAGVHKMKEDVKTGKAPKKSYVDLMEERAKDALARYRAKKGLIKAPDVLRAAGDDDIFTDMATVGASHIAGGTDDFHSFQEAMMKDFPDEEITMEHYEASKQMHDQARADYEGEAGKTVKEALAAMTVGEDHYLDPSEVRTLAMAHIEAGAETVEDLLDLMFADLKPLFPDVTKREIQDAISGYGKRSYPSDDEIQQTLTELSSQMRLLSQYEDVMAGKSPEKTGFQRGDMSDRVRELGRLVRDLMKANGINPVDPATQLKSALQAAKTRMRNLIADLNKWIAGGGRPEVAKQAGINYDDEANALASEAARLRGVLKAIEGPAQMTDAQRIQSAERALETAIKRLEENIGNGGLGPIIDPKQSSAYSPKIGEMEKKIAALRKQREELRKAAKPKTDPEEQRLKEKEADLDRQIKKMQENVAAGAPKAAGPRLGPYPESISAKQARLRELRQLRNELRLAANPKLTPKEKALRAYKSRIMKQTSDLKARLKIGDFSTKERKKIELDAEATRLKAENINARHEFEIEREKARIAALSPLRQSLRWLVKLHRTFVISRVASLVKIFSMSVGRTVSMPLEQLALMPWRLVPGVKDIVQGSARYHSFDPKVEAAAFTQGWTGFVKNFGERMKKGESDWETALRYDDPSLKEFRDLDPSWMDYVGNLHNSLKGLAMENEYARSFGYRVQHDYKAGVDPSDPGRILYNSVLAYNDALRAKLMQPNFLSEGWQHLLHWVEHSKMLGEGGPYLADFLRYVAPVTKVPTNVAIEGFWYSPAGALAAMGNAAYKLAKGLDKMPEDVRLKALDDMSRHFAKSTFGTLIWLVLGAVAIAGGYYLMRSKRKDTDPKYNTIRVGGHNIPKEFTHHPLFNSLQMQATYDRVRGHITKKGPKAGQKPSFMEGVKGAARGALGELPFTQDISNVTDFFTGDEEAAGREARDMLIPGLVQELAAAIDREQDSRHSPETILEYMGAGKGVERKPKGAIQQIEAGIPGLRSNVPATEPKPVKEPKLASPTRRFQSWHALAPR